MQAQKVQHIQKIARKEEPQDFLSFEDWSLDYQMEPDEIISQLAKVSLHSIHSSGENLLNESFIAVMLIGSYHVPCPIISQFTHWPVHIFVFIDFG